MVSDFSRIITLLRKEKGVTQKQAAEDLGVSQAEHPEVFKKVPSEKEGGRMVKETTEYLFTTGKVFLIPYFYLQCMGKYAGYFLGKHYKMLPAKTIKKCTANEAYWQ